MKFLADMGISPRTVDFLRGIGYDATHLHEEGLDRMPDSDILTRARRERCVLLTIEQHREALESGALVTVTEGHIRVRRLPIERAR